MEIKTTSQQAKIKEQAIKNHVKTEEKKQKSPPQHTHTNKPYGIHFMLPNYA